MTAGTSRWAWIAAILFSQGDLLGVDPTRQGQGIGSKLLSAGVERADTSGLPCYLETMNPDNVPLYQKFGFAVANEGDIPESNVHVWGMVRPAHVHL